MRKEAGWKLVGEALAGPGGHQDEGVAASEDVFEDLTLAGAKTLDSEAVPGF